MTKNIGQLTSEIFALLEGLDKEESSKVITSVAALLGLGNISTISNQNGGEKGKHTMNNGIPANSSESNINLQSAKAFFDSKDPKTKGEEFAVAAKFRVDNNLGDSHSKEDLKAIIKNQAKRKFDDSNFKRDIDNAIRQAHFFMTGDERGAYILSSIGEKYIDALPDRDAATETRKGAKKEKNKTVKNKPK